jgi:hypothetical protein
VAPGTQPTPKPPPGLENPAHGGGKAETHFRARGRFTLGGKATAGRLRPPPQKGNRTQGQAHYPSSQYMKALQRGRATLRLSTSKPFPEHGSSGHKGLTGRQQLDVETLWIYHTPHQAPYDARWSRQAETADLSVSSNDQGLGHHGSDACRMGEMKLALFKSLHAHQPVTLCMAFLKYV